MDKAFLGVIAISVTDAVHDKYPEVNRDVVETIAYNTISKLWETNTPLHMYAHELASDIAPRYHLSFVETKKVLKNLNFSL
jgi:hypothetical protein